MQEDLEESDVSEEEDVGTQTKRKKSQLSAEGIEQGKVIEALERRYRCEDNSCSMSPCYVAGPQAEHIHLTHRHLRLWSSGIVMYFSSFNLPRTDHFGRLKKSLALL